MSFFNAVQIGILFVHPLPVAGHGFAPIGYSDSDSDSPAERLLQKLSAWAPRKTFPDVVTSWLRPRTARVDVAGESSTEMVMKNMVYQGAVWGPWLWNTFFRNAAPILRNFSKKLCLLTM